MTNQQIFNAHPAGQPADGAVPSPCEQNATGKRDAPDVVVPRSYPRFWVGPKRDSWRPVVALILAVALFLAMSLLIFSIVWVFQGGGSGAGSLTPAEFGANNLSLASFLVAAAVVSLWPMGQRPGNLFSVAGRLRWRWLGRIALWVTPYWALTTVIDYQISGEFPTFEMLPQTVPLIIIVLTTQVFQSAGEEMAFRGVLTRTVGALIPGRVVGVVVAGLVSSLLFTLVHGAGDPWLNALYFLFGATAAYLTWRTGGLEAAIVLHSVNNLSSAVALPFEDLSQIADRSSGAGSPRLIYDMAVILGAALIVTLLARKTRPQREGLPCSAPHSEIGG